MRQPSNNSKNVADAHVVDGGFVQDGKHMISNTQHGYCQLTLDASSLIQSALLCTAKQEPHLPPAMLLPLVGLPVTYLHELLHGYETGKVSDMPEYLRQPWTELLYHDGFPQLRSALMQNVTGQPLQELDSNAGSKDDAFVTRVQTEVVDFIKQQGPVEFPKYAVSAFIS